MSVISGASSISASAATQIELDRCHWHRRLGHPSDRKFDFIMRELIRRPELAVHQKGGIRHELDCDVCKRNKCKKARWKYSLRAATYPLQMVYMNLDMRPADEEDQRNGPPIIVVDDYSRYSWVLEPEGRELQDIRVAVETWLNTAERQSGLRVMRVGLRTSQVNNLGPLQDWLKGIGVEIEWLDSTLSTDDSDVCGRHTRRLLELATVLFHDSGLPADFFFEILAAAAYLRNRVGFVHKTDKTPYELWFGREPTYSHIRTFGCRVEYYYNPDNRPATARMAKREGILLGFDTSDSHYWVLTKQDELIVTQDLRFTENERGGLAEIPIRDIFDIVRPARFAHAYSRQGSVTSEGSDCISVGTTRSDQTYNSRNSGSSGEGSVRSSLSRVVNSFTGRPSRRRYMPHGPNRSNDPYASINEQYHEDSGSDDWSASASMHQRRSPSLRADTASDFSDEDYRRTIRSGPARASRHRA